MKDLRASAHSTCNERRLFAIIYSCSNLRSRFMTLEHANRELEALECMYHIFKG